MKSDILHILSHLLYPHQREWAIGALEREGVLTAKTAAVLRTLLSEERYSYRTLFRSIGPIKVQLDEFVRSHTFNKLRPLGGMFMIDNYRRGRENQFAYRELCGKSVLDFGAGVLSPLTVSILMYVNGAGRVTAFEPAGWKKKFLQASVAELIAQLHLNPKPYNFSGIENGEMLARLTELDFDGTLDADGVVSLGPITLVKEFDFSKVEDEFDLIVSNSVLEHVENFEVEIKNHLKALRKGGLSINRVDFTDHRHGFPEFTPFGFYYDGVRCGCNLLRVSDLRSAASRTCGDFSLEQQVLADEKQIAEHRLIDRFRAYDKETLLTKSATLIMRGE